MDSHKIAEFLRSATRLAVVSHQGPDGDSIGSSLALAHGLRRLGKHVDVISAEKPPAAFAFLPGSADILLRRRVDGDYRGVVILECSDFRRTGLLGLEEHFTVNIDHHPGGGSFADLNWVDEKASAVGMLVDDLLGRLGAPIDADIATCLYLAVLTDTGSFQFPNTDASTFQAVARWVEAGAQPGIIAHQVYRRQPEARLRLLGTALELMESDPQAGLAWIELRSNHLEQAAAGIEHTEGLVNYPLSLEGIKASAVMREDPQGACRISLRSKGDIDVGALARRMGGGGHVNAAGMTLQGDWSDIRGRVLRQLGELVQTGRVRVKPSEAEDG